ncbi:MAG TPA: hypothetical protein VMM78_09620 [Thermomicrobiales bacterium]|nr:hypothetical protein [Thermomicrobiales bacterium]
MLVLLATASGMQLWPVASASAQEFVPTIEWRMLARHTGQSLIDSDDLTVARAYVHPDVYTVAFDGCPSFSGGEGVVTHTYTITGGELAEPRVIVHSARPRRILLPQRGGWESVSCDDLEMRTDLPLDT